MIDYVIDMNNIAKFGSGKIFPDGGTYTHTYTYTYTNVHIRVRHVFNFLRSLMKVQKKTAEPILTLNMSIDVVW